MGFWQATEAGATGDLPEEIHSDESSLGPQRRVSLGAQRRLVTLEACCFMSWMLAIGGGPFHTRKPLGDLRNGLYGMERSPLRPLEQSICIHISIWQGLSACQIEMDPTENGQDGWWRESGSDTCDGWRTRRLGYLASLPDSGSSLQFQGSW